MQIRQTLPLRNRPVHRACVKAHAHSTEPRASKATDIALNIVGAAAAASLLLNPAVAIADEAVNPTSTVPETVYFGNGCFWGRQHDFIMAEQELGRDLKDLSAVVGYAGGAKQGYENKVCYYYADPRTVYEKLGHAEVTSVKISQDPETAAKEFRTFAKTYFSEFNKTPFGMIRQDPQDSGPGYRNVIGLPGGVTSPLYKILQEENVNNMVLKEGRGNTYVNGKATESDQLNMVWVVDSTSLPFYQAEKYHQFHDGLGYAFPTTYTKDLKDKMASMGRIDPTGCPELPF